MTKKMVYALNKISGVVTEIDAETLTHPTVGKNFVEVDDPRVCIGCGVQPDGVTTVEGEVVDLAKDEAEKPAEAPKPAKTNRKDK